MVRSVVLFPAPFEPERYDFSLFYTPGKPVQGLDLAIGNNYILQFKERHES
jgi:hypothetical protein